LIDFRCKFQDFGLRNVDDFWLVGVTVAPPHQALVVS
jgi:hypothetical protein